MDSSNVYTILDVDSICKYHTSNDVFPRVQNVCKIITGKSFDEVLQHDNKMRIWARSENSEKWKIYEWVTKHNMNVNDDMYACVTLHDTNVNDDIHAYVALHSAHTCNHIPLSVVRILSGRLSCLHLHTCTLAQV